MEDQDDQTCLSAGISVSFQKHYSLLCQLGFSNHDAAEHLVLFCVQCSCHRSVIEKWNQVHSSRPVNAMQSLLYWPFSECYTWEKYLITTFFGKQKILKFFFLQTDQLYLFYWLLVVPLAIFIAAPVVSSRT